MKIALRACAVHADKLTRALPLATRAESGKLAFVRGSWNKSALDELCGFPESDHDDVVDAMSAGMQMLSGSSGANATPINAVRRMGVRRGETML